MKFATFFLGEYANMVVVSAIWSSLFLGGYLAPLPWLNQLPANLTRLYEFNAQGARDAAHWGIPWLTMIINSVVPWVWYALKVFAGLYFFIWIRATLPRLRYDMLMKFGWQGILPIALINILLVAVALTLYGMYGVIGYLIALVLWLIVAGIAVVAFVKSKPAQIFIVNTRRNTTVNLHHSAQPFRGIPEHAGSGGQTLPSDAKIGGFAVAESERAADAIDAALTSKKG